MVGAGFSVHTEREAQVLALGRGEDPESPQAVAIAVQDYQCQRSALLGEATTAARERLTTAWIEANPEAIADLSKAVDEVVRRSTSV
jgi:hypothetical protein